MLHNSELIKKGFTLVELLIVFVVIAILSSILVANFSEIRQQLALKRAAHKLAQDIRWAQEMATSSAEFKESENCDPSFYTAYGYGIYIDFKDDKKKYILYADINGDENYSSADCKIKTISIEEKGIVIEKIKNTEPNDKVAINFKPPNPNINIKWLLSGQNEVEIVLALEQDLSKTKSILVNNAGLIEIK